MRKIKVGMVVYLKDYSEIASGGSIQAKAGRPFLIVQADNGSGVVTGLALTHAKKRLDLNVEILDGQSVVLTNMFMPINKYNISKIHAIASDEDMKKVKEALFRRMF